MALALAAICLIPVTFGLLGELLWRLAERIPGSMLAIAVSELRSTATRSIALAGVAALAVYGSVAIGGARADLLHGIDGAINHYFATAPVWVVVDQEIFNTNAFAGDGVAARDRARAWGGAGARLPGRAARRRRAPVVGARPSAGRSGDARSGPGGEREPRAGHGADPPRGVGWRSPAARRRTPPAGGRLGVAAHPVGLGALRGRRDHDELGVASGRDHAQCPRLQPLLAHV